MRQVMADEVEPTVSNCVILIVIIIKIGLPQVPLQRVATASPSHRRPERRMWTFPPTHWGATRSHFNEFTTVVQVVRGGRPDTRAGNYWGLILQSNENVVQKRLECGDVAGEELGVGVRVECRRFRRTQAAGDAARDAIGGCGMSQRRCTFIP
jgi:hypothetical protein